jgi:hypothetical protein
MMIQAGLVVVPYEVAVEELDEILSCELEPIFWAYVLGVFKVACPLHAFSSAFPPPLKVGGGCYYVNDPLRAVSNIPARPRDGAYLDHDRDRTS